MKVMTFVGTRPEVIKLSRVIPELDKHVEHALVHTGQNTAAELNKNIFHDLGLRHPDVLLGAHSTHGPAATIAAVLEGADLALNEYTPDAVLILGDTNSAYAALAAKRRKIPVFHMEAGNRCFDERVPEEINRRVIDHISDINMPYTEHARRNLLAEGIAPDRIITTGSPMREVLDHYALKISQSESLHEFDLWQVPYYVVSAHREENVDDPDRLLALVDTVNRLARDARVIFSLHPRTRKRLNEQKLLFTTNVTLTPPLGFFDYAQLQRWATCVISDSGSLAEEAAMLNFPAVTIRQAHERPESSDEGTLVMSDLVQEQVLAAVKLATMQKLARNAPEGYDVPNVAQKVVRTIVSYTDYVNRVVWRK